jgi:hypothetical protein
MNQSNFNSNQPRPSFLTLPKQVRDFFVKKNKSQFRMSENQMMSVLNSHPHSGTFSQAISNGKCFDYTKGPVSPRVKTFLDEWYAALLKADPNAQVVCKGPSYNILPELWFKSNSVILNSPGKVRFTITHDHIDIHISAITSGVPGLGSQILEAFLEFCEHFKHAYGFCPTIRCECLGALQNNYSPEEPTIEKQLRFFQKHGFKIDKITDCTHYLSYNP